MRTWVDISLGQLARNYRNIHACVGASVAVAGIVKANAYGHGAVPVSRTLVEEGAEWLGVSNVTEGIELRRAGIEARILVMGGVLPFERDSLVEHNLTPVVHSLDELSQWDSVGAFDVHLKIDTGMSRLGMREEPASIAAAISALKRVHVEGLMSHFATPDNPEQSEAQLARFHRSPQGCHAGGHPLRKLLCPG